MYYFASDVHLGAGTREQQRATEERFVEWLEEVSHDAEAIFLCGDIFDFWFEYQRVVPKGFVRTLAKIAEFTHRGIRVVFMAGNHDMWIRDYFEQECGVEIYTTPTTFPLGAKRVHVAHGDNLNVKGDIKLKIMNGIFRSSVVRALFSWLIHPDLALAFGHWWSGASRKKHTNQTQEDIDRSVGFLREYALNHYTTHHDDLYIFGHLHHKADFTEEQPQIIFMNDWSRSPHYIAISEDGCVKLCQAK